MPRYAPDHAIDPDSAACPVVGLAIDTRDHESEWHMHRRTQLLYQAEGSLTLHMADRVGRLAPLQAVWLPAGSRHRTVMHGGFAYRSLYFDIDAYRQLPTLPLIIEINPLLRELILRITEWSADEALNSTQQRLMATLLDELESASSAPLHLPMPHDKRLLVLTRALLEDPGLTLTLREWGLRVGASDRTLARIFLRETGLSFKQWRTQSRLLAAHSLLAEGASVTVAAHAVGYASDSAFIAMYRRMYGATPGQSNKARS